MPTTVLENSLRASSGVYVVVGAMHAAAEVVAIALARVLLNEAITLPATVGVVGVVLALFILSWYDNAQPRRPGKTKIQE